MSIFLNLIFAVHHKVIWFYMCIERSGIVVGCELFMFVLELSLGDLVFAALDIPFIPRVCL